MIEEKKEPLKNNEKSSWFDRAAEKFFIFTRGIGLLVKEFGMPVVAFAAGIAVLIILIYYKGDKAIEYKIVVGLILVVVGLCAQIFIHCHDNPRETPKPPPIDPVLDRHLKDMITLILVMVLNKNREK
jgi:hypothetical protein